MDGAALGPDAAIPKSVLIAGVERIESSRPRSHLHPGSPRMAVRAAAQAQKKFCLIFPRAGGCRSRGLRESGRRRRRITGAPGGRGNRLRQRSRQDREEPPRRGRGLSRHSRHAAPSESSARIARRGILEVAAPVGVVAAIIPVHQSHFHGHLQNTDCPEGAQRHRAQPASLGDRAASAKPPRCWNARREQQERPRALSFACSIPRCREPRN